MANNMSFSIGHADASSTSHESKDSVNDATIYTIPNSGIQNRRWLSRLFLLGIVLSVFASNVNLNAQSDTVIYPRVVGMVTDSTNRVAMWSMDTYELKDRIAGKLTCGTGQCATTWEDVWVEIDFDVWEQSYYISYTVYCPWQCSGVFSGAIYLTEIEGFLYMYANGDNNEQWVNEMLDDMDGGYPTVPEKTWGWWYVDGKWRWGWIEGIHVWGNWYYGNLFYRDDNNKLQMSQWFYERRTTNPNGFQKMNGLLSQEFKFGLSPGDNLQVKTSYDATCDVYELITGKLLLQNVNVIGSSSYQSISVKPANTPYVIMFKVDGNPVSLQHFIFNSPTSLSIGGN